MDHLCYLDKRKSEYEEIVDGLNRKIVRCMSSNVPPYKHVFTGDKIFFVNEKKNIVLQTEVVEVENIDLRSNSEIRKMIMEKFYYFNLSKRRARQLLRKKYLVFITLGNVKKINIVQYSQRKHIKRHKWILAGSFHANNI